jgi:tRNA-binding EMAP/Myf-like protein
MANKNDQKPRPKMDTETAMAFAGHAFESLHPRPSWPYWLRDCLVTSVNRKKNGDYVISFAVTLKGTQDADSLFVVEVDCLSAETKVLVDQSLTKYDVSQLVGGETTTTNSNARASNM